PRVLVLRPVVPAPGDAPRAAGRGLELGEVQLPHLVRPRRFGGERGLPAGRELAAFPLVGGGQDQPFIAQQAQHGGLADPVPVVAHHGPHLAVPPCRMRQRVPPRGHAHALARRARPRPLDRGPGPGAGLPAPPRPLGHADHLAEPRGRHARLDADHLEVLEGPSRPSADFFHTRTSRCASPRAWVNSATSASSCCSRVEGPDFPAARPVLPASRNARFQFPTDCSDTFARRAASATVTSPAKTDNTILVFSSAGTAGGLAMNDQTPHRSGPQATGPATKSDARHAHPRCRMSALAAAVGTSAPTVSRRLASLFEQQLIRVVSVVDQQRAGYGFAVSLRLRCVPGASGDVARAVAQWPESGYVSVVGGD